MLNALIQILGLFINLVIYVVVAQFILSLLLIFNVISRSNSVVASIEQALNAILDPVLRPIRKIMPDTGAIDFSAMVLIFGLMTIQILLGGVADSMLTGTL
jgi:YggT family protein